MFQARISSPKKFEIQEVEIPLVSTGQCLVKLERWSVCGSDIRHAFGPVFPEEEYPMRPGSHCHECAGTIVETKSDKFKIGQRVIMLPTGPVEGSGGLVEYYAADEKRMALLPDEGDLGEWLMCQPSGTVLYACQQMGTILGKDVVIMGQGSIGLSFTAICARAGANKVITVDPLDYRLEWSKNFGATHTINPDKENLDEVLAEITSGKMADISVEASGFPDALNAALRSTTFRGKVILFGIQESGEMSTIDTHAYINNAPIIMPVAGGRTPDPTGHIEKMISLKQRGWWDPGLMKTHERPFSELQDAYEDYEGYKDNIVKVVLHND